MQRILVTLIALAMLTASSVAHAKPRLLRLWADVHGTVLGGQGQYFDAQNGPYVGGGGQLGLALLVFEVYLDVNVFDTGRDSDEVAPTMWTQLGAGINAPISLGPKLELFGRVNGSLTAAPYSLDDHNSGFVFRGGGGLEFKATSVIRLGAACYGGYHFYGSRENDDNGSHIMGQLYTRFELGF